jgi:hypothetical protein
MNKEHHERDGEREKWGYRRSGIYREEIERECGI